jgi:hypothetical protein
MTTLRIFIITISLLFFSCNKNKIDTSIKKESAKISILTIDTIPKKETKSVVSYSDTIKRLIVDNYLITNKMLLKESENNPLLKIESGKTISIEKAWFKNDNLDQTLIVQIATDYHRLLIYHFTNKDIPTELINEMEFHIDGGELASTEQKRKDFNGFIKQATQIESSYFISEKGFRIGDTKQKVINTYGEPDKKTIYNGIEKLNWNFIGEISYDSKTELKGKPLVVNSFGYQVEMYFKNGKLIALILFNEIP